ncbi:hypothetical protein BASA83_007663 [Batrachochytrium salamandrivorans]|nr:hypothetical protein BASA83_007663 [Batrachochytrium salamandrivorans]
MSNLKEIVASLTDRLRSLELENQTLQQDQRYDTDRKKIATLGTLLTDKALAWYNPYIEQPDTTPTTYPLGDLQSKDEGNFGEINQEQVSRPSFVL